MRFVEGDPPATAIPVTDLYGDVVGEIIVDRDGRLSGQINMDSFWGSVSRIGRLGPVQSVSLMPNL